MIKGVYFLSLIAITLRVSDSVHVAVETKVLEEISHNCDVSGQVSEVVG